MQLGCVTEIFKGAKAVFMKLIKSELSEPQGIMLKVTTFFDWAYSNLMLFNFWMFNPYKRIYGVRKSCFDDLFLNLKTKVDLFRL